MKYLILGIFIGLLTFPLLGDLSETYRHLNPESEVADKISRIFIITGYNAQYAFIGYCTKDVSVNGHGWVFVNREFFSCGKLSILISDLIYGERTEPINPELEKKACTDCNLR